jgi:hypothetical protein
MKDQLFIIPAGRHYSVSAIHEQIEVSSLRLGLRQLTISDPAGQCQALMAGFNLESTRRAKNGIPDRVVERNPELYPSF